MDDSQTLLGVRVMWKRGTWKKGRRTLTGQWRWDWARQRFFIHLNSRDPVTGEARRLEVSGDEPEFNGWQLVRTQH